MKIEDVKEHIDEMIQQFEQLPARISRKEIDGFIFGLCIDKNIGWNLSKDILNLSVDDRCGIVSALLLKLEVTPEQYNEHLKGALSGVLGLFKRSF